MLATRELMYSESLSAWKALIGGIVAGVAAWEGLSGPATAIADPAGRRKLPVQPGELGS